MQANKVYDEVIEFIASSSPQNVIALRSLGMTNGCDDETVLEAKGGSGGDGL